ncbi:MAG: TIGR02206 family membrane protein [Bacteroidetes bacterium]|nr:TIGR02206 family membrane protein [Bacteroidota bacterium]
MSQYFAIDYQGRAFELFGSAHLFTLLALAIVGMSTIVVARRRPQSRRSLGLGFAAILLVNELSWHAWNLYWGTWNLDRMLPLHLCSIMVWITVFGIATKHPRIRGPIYFLGVAGALQALITPDAGVYGYPHFRFFQTMIAHGGLVIAGFFVVFVDRYRPTIRCVMEVLLGLNVYALVVGLLNPTIGSNYLYLAHKPDIATVMDLMPAWPWYIPILELIALLLFMLLFLPFEIARRRKIAGATLTASVSASRPLND